MAIITEYEPFPNYQEYGDVMEGFEAEEVVLKEILATKECIRFQRGDGYAIYVVARRKPLTLAWIPFGDRWRADPIIEKHITLEEVDEMLRREKALREIFGGRKKK